MKAKKFISNLNFEMILCNAKFKSNIKRERKADRERQKTRKRETAANIVR